MICRFPPALAIHIYDYFIFVAKFFREEKIVERNENDGSQLERNLSISLFHFC